MQPAIYKVVSTYEWQEASESGIFKGAAIDLTDGYIHFSTKEQVQETVDKHFQGQDNLLLIRFEAGQFGEDLKWEVSRGGALFPHLYADLPCDSAESTWELPMNEDGSHQFPADF